jgi:acyl-CoA reductase-like NAD-dependent aldehyde dehydrogenase
LAASVKLAATATLVWAANALPATSNENAVLVASRRIFVNFKSRNAGQVCVSPTRFFVQESIYQRFADSFAEKAAQLKVGDGLDPKMQIGPLANSRRIDAMEALVAVRPAGAGQSRSRSG